MGNISMKIIGCWLVVFFMLAVTATAQAALYTLTDDNSTAEIDPNSSDGVWSWTIDASDHMYQQWFWYRIGDAGPETSIDTLTLLGSLATNTDPFPGDPALDTLSLFYADGVDLASSTFTVEVSFNLDGGSTGSNLSDIAEQISITNLSDSTLDFHFFQYSDFDLNSSPNDTVELVNANTVRQSDLDWTISETVVTPAADGFELDFFGITRGKLNDAAATTLGNAFGTGPVGPGNVTWAFQWDETISAGGAFQISKDKNMTPEPATLGLLLIGGLILLRRRYT